MDSYNKISILKNIYENKKDELNIKDSFDLIEKMKFINGKAISDMFDALKSKDNDKLTIVSDLFRHSMKSSVIIDDCVNKLEDRIEKDKEKENSEINKVNNNVLNNFDIEQIKYKKNKGSLILFYAEWCGFCKRLMPLWDKLEKDLSDKYNFIKISCVEKQEQCKKIKYIDGYPTILYLNNLANNKTNIQKFEGERSYEGFVQFLQEVSK